MSLNESRQTLVPYLDVEFPITISFDRDGATIAGEGTLVRVTARWGVIHTKQGNLRGRSFRISGAVEADKVFHSWVRAIDSRPVDGEKDLMQVRFEFEREELASENPLMKHFFLARTRRRSSRFPAILKGQILFPKGMGELRITEVSMNGVLAVSEVPVEPLVPGTPMRLRVRIPKLVTPFEVDAVVVHRRKTEVPAPGGRKRIETQLGLSYQHFEGHEKAMWEETIYRLEQEHEAKVPEDAMSSSSPSITQMFDPVGLDEVRAGGSLRDRAGKPIDFAPLTQENAETARALLRKMKEDGKLHLDGVDPLGLARDVLVHVSSFHGNVDDQAQVVVEKVFRLCYLVMKSNVKPS